MELVYELGHLSLETLKAQTTNNAKRIRVTSPLHKLFFDSFFTLRDPQWHCFSVDERGFIDDAADWHQDGQYDSVKWMILWTNHTPTHIRRTDTFQEMTMKPFTLTLIDNWHCEHRAPQLSQDACLQRWFIRSHLSHDLTDDDIHCAIDKLALIR